MLLRLKNLKEVRLFALAISCIAVTGTLFLTRIMLAPEVFAHIVFVASFIAVALAAPISYFVGLRLLDITRLTQELEYAVNHDALTGVMTRVRFHQLLEQMPDDEMVLIVADIDHFKKVNDDYGHKFGDFALKQFTNTLVRNLREQDLVARFGGEEFVILLHGVSRAEGIATAERLCDAVRKKRIFFDGKELRLTASFGGVSASTATETEKSFQKADMAAYRAKAEGRDRVCFHDPRMDAPDAGSPEAA